VSDADYLIAIAAALGAAGLALLPACYRTLRRAALMRAGALGGAALLLIGLGAAGVLTGSMLHAYRNLVWEQPVATLGIERHGPARYRVELALAGGGPAGAYLLRGDQWQLDARVLRWRPAASALGLRPRYRIERLSSRYADASATARPDVHDLRGEDAAVIGQWLRRLEHLLPWLDSIYGSATYMPLADGARFEVLLSRSGLLAKPVNEAAKQSVLRWH